MSCYNLLVIYLVSLFSIQDGYFVDFKSDGVKISTTKELLTVVLPFQILENHHIQTEKLVDNNLIPTEIHFEVPKGFEIVDYGISKAIRTTLRLGQLRCEVLSEELEITIQLRKNSNNDRSNTLKGYLYYQACDDRQCFYPRTLYFNLNLVEWP